VEETPKITFAEPRSIFCVEDDVDTCEVLTILLREYRFGFVHTIYEAMKRLAAGRDDLYILDNWLPDGSGVDICRRIREIYADAPILFTSAVAGKTDVDLAMHAGANQYLLKPCEPETLQRVVKELLYRTTDF
jgi:DNA-binding response OmpR family regulator